MRLTRRGLLIGAAAGGGLLVAYGLMPRRYAPPLPPAKGETAYNAWIKIGRDGVVTVAVPQLEMGQGVTTLIPQIVAVELGADWRQIAVEPAAVSAAYANPVIAAKWAPVRGGLTAGLQGDPEGRLARRFAESQALMVTADGTTLAAYEQPAREAAAAVRAMLAQAAAARWDVAWEECEAQGGFIVNGKRRMRFADLAEDAARYDPPDPPVLRPEPARERPGDAARGLVTAFPRLDAPAKVDGSFGFAGDVRLPNMVYAAIAHGPVGDAVLAGFDEQAAVGIPGLIGVVKGRRWLAAAASDWWAADRALQAMRPRWRVESAVDTAAIEQALDAALRRGEAERTIEDGDPDAVIGRPASLVARYGVAPGIHATIETSTATARFDGAKLELWLASQAPEQARRAVAGALGMRAADVVIYPVAAGGSFDRRLEHEVGIEAASIARTLDRPVQLIYSRREEALRGWPRTPVGAVLAAKTVAGGQIAAWRARIAVPATNRAFAARLFDRETPLEALAASGDDPLALEGARPAYAIPHLAIDRVPVELTLPTGRLRGNAHGYTAFFTESFVDELAHLARREPLSYRIEMLGNDVRLAACLTAAARLGQWGGGGEQSGEGLACHRMDDIADQSGGGRIAVIATARRDARGVRVDRIAAVADIGRIVNLDLARQQVEGGLIFGLGMAMGCAAHYQQGVPVTSRLAGLGLPYLSDSPEIAVDFIDSNAAPFDPGELGAVAVAPAVANALFSATGARFRRLPLLSEDV